MAALLDIRSKQEFPLHSVLTLIGRDPACDIVVDSPVVSARHFIILHRNGSYSLEDLGRMNGTFVKNGHRLARRTRLYSGDQITVIGLTLEFRDADTPEEQSSVQPAANAETISSTSDARTIRLSELVNAKHIPELSSLEVDGDLRLSVKPEIKLRAVLEIARNLSHSLELKVVLPQILDSLFTIFPAADCGFVLLRDLKTGAIIPLCRKVFAILGIQTRFL